MTEPRLLLHHDAGDDVEERIESARVAAGRAQGFQTSREIWSSINAAKLLRYTQAQRRNPDPGFFAAAAFALE